MTTPPPPPPKRATRPAVPPPPPPRRSPAPVPVAAFCSPAARPCPRFPSDPGWEGVTIITGGHWGGDIDVVRAAWIAQGVPAADADTLLTEPRLATDDCVWRVGPGTVREYALTDRARNDVRAALWDSP